jgi:CheY-like chemotaxis protein
VVVRGDAARLAQVFRNLLGNALKYTGPDGRIHVKVAAAGAEAVVSVRDSGVGIDADVLPRIFDLFVQADSSLARSQGGLGIGLTLVRHVVRMHGGNVEAWSAGRGHGSEFEVRLPLSAAVASTPAPGSAETTEAGARRVLLIEDNRDSRQMLRLLLELKGHRVQEAADGRAGIKLAVEGAPDVVLVDIGLPDMDGYAVAERLRKLLGRGVRLVALTGYGDPHARRRARAAGFDAFLVKPVDPEQLAAAMAATPS